jgi:hypothetical protein
LLTDPVDQARSIEQRCCLVQKFLHVECDFEALLVKPGARASICCASIPAALSSLLRISVRKVLIVVSTNCASISVNSFVATTHASRAGKVERKESNLVARFGVYRASLDPN